MVLPASGSPQKFGRSGTDGSADAVGSTVAVARFAGALRDREKLIHKIAANSSKITTPAPTSQGVSERGGGDPSPCFSVRLNRDADNPLPLPSNPLDATMSARSSNPVPDPVDPSALPPRR